MLPAAPGSFLDPPPKLLNSLQASGFKVASKLRILFAPQAQGFRTDVASFSCKIIWQTRPYRTTESLLLKKDPVGPFATRIRHQADRLWHYYLDYH